MTVINNTSPQPVQTQSTGSNVIIPLVVLVLVILFFVYGISYIRNSGIGTGNTGTSVNVPKQIDVNVHTNSK